MSDTNRPGRDKRRHSVSTCPANLNTRSLLPPQLHGQMCVPAQDAAHVLRGGAPLPALLSDASSLATPITMARRTSYYEASLYTPTKRRVYARSLGAISRHQRRGPRSRRTLRALGLATPIRNPSPSRSAHPAVRVCMRCASQTRYCVHRRSSPRHDRGFGARPYGKRRSCIHCSDVCHRGCNFHAPESTGTSAVRADVGRGRDAPRPGDPCRYRYYMCD